MQNTKARWKYHILLLIIIVLMDFFGDYVYGGKQRFLRNFELPYSYMVILFYVSFYSVYVLNYWVLAPLTLTQKKIIPFLGGLLILFFVFAGVRYFLEEVMLYSFTGQHNYNGESRRLFYYVFDNSYYALKSVLFSTSLFLLFQFIDNRNKMHQLELEHKKSELDFLKSQIGPHFLFNTLNTFYSELIEIQPQTARDIHKLSDLLRYVTYEAQQNFIEAKKDLKFIDDYIYFFKKRFEDQLCLEYTIEGEVPSQKLPSMVLIHFVENLFKHGTVNDIENPAQIKIRFLEGYWEIYTRNKITASEKYTEGGIGFNSVKRRLDVLFENKYTLSNESENNYFTAYLKCPYA